MMQAWVGKMQRDMEEKLGGMTTEMHALRTRSAPAAGSAVDQQELAQLRAQCRALQEGQQAIHAQVQTLSAVQKTSGS